MATHDDKKKIIIQKSDPRLAFLWSSSCIPIDIQYKLVEAGCVSMPNFKNIASNNDGLRECLDKDFGLKPVGMENRITIANIVTAFEAATVQVDQESLVAAEHRVSGLARPIQGSDYNILMATVESLHGEVQNKSTGQVRFTWASSLAMQRAASTMLKLLIK